jgi:predicted O-methyltransferase YrrM
MKPPLEIVDPRIEAYLQGLAPRRDPVLAEMESLAERKDFPIVGPLVGALLQLLASSIQARRILELGSGFGYSAIWFARAAGPEGRVVATETSPENVTLARGFLARAALQERVEFHAGNALEIASRLEGPFDVVFNDIDKRDYPKALAVAESLLRPGGLFISDNMLWKGNVVRDPADDATRGVTELTRLLRDSPRYLTTLVPLRDGVSVSLRTA